MNRYQPLCRHFSISLFGAYGRISGSNIPLNRKFFIGGLGTLHGYGHKESMGREYVLFGTEYKFPIGRSDFVPFIRHDFGRIALVRLSSFHSWQNSISIGMALKQGLKMFISYRLDGSDEDPRFYARFSFPTY